MTASEFSGPGLSVEQWRHIEALAVSLTPQQMAWVSGYFAGFDAAVRGRGADVGSLLAAGTQTEAPVRTLTILHAGETGNSAALARAMAEQAQALGLAPTVVDMADYKLRQLKAEQDLIVITSTHGEGDPPQGAADFFEYVESRKAPSLLELRYAVLALGDSTYERYCEAGRRLDQRFEALNGTRLHPRADCDVDYEETAAGWAAAVIPLLVPDAPSGTGDATAGVRAASAPAPGQGVDPAVAFDKRRPFLATVIDNFVLTGRGSSKETRHVELSLAGSGLRFEPGDSLGIAPRNDPKVVETVLDALAMAADAPLDVKGRATTVADALESDFEIATATPRFLEHWAGVTDAAELKALIDPENLDKRRAYLGAHHVIDIVRAFPAPGVEPQALIAGLRPLQPRLYSIASSPTASADEAHLTVSTVRYDLHGEPRGGVTSVQLAERAPLDSTLPVYVQPNPHFRLPEADAPILMIGAGTGVAPFRAFLQEREAQGAAGRSWLFFGERNFRTDFLYQTEWQGLLKDGALTRLDVAFSRDQTHKVYVQDRLREHAAEVFAWMEDGAHVYVCGDAARLAPDVHDALIWILERQGGHNRESAEDHLRSLQRDRRYQLDVY